MKIVLFASVLLGAAPAAAQTQSPGTADLTRALNSGPPVAARPAAPPSAQSRDTSSAPAPVPPAAPGPSPTASTSPSAAPGASRVSTSPQAAPVSAPVAVPTPSAPAPSPAALSPAAIAALPFRIDLPSGFQLTESRGGPDAKVWSVRKAGKTFVMIYAGPASQFPIYDGEQVTAAGRVSVVVPDGARRIAMEHLFQRSSAPAEIHVWLMSQDGADRDAAERIAQSVDPK